MEGSFEISVSGVFSAAHQLRFPDGTLEPLHGHNWRVRATFRGPDLDELGVLLDFTVIQPQVDAVLAELHDKHLNDLSSFQERNASAENVALHIAEQLTARLDARARECLACVEVEESPGCVARFIPG